MVYEVRTQAGHGALLMGSRGRMLHGVDRGLELPHPSRALGMNPNVKTDHLIYLIEHEDGTQSKVMVSDRRTVPVYETTYSGMYGGFEQRFRGIEQSQDVAIMVKGVKYNLVNREANEIAELLGVKSCHTVKGRYLTDFIGFLGAGYEAEEIARQLASQVNVSVSFSPDPVARQWYPRKAISGEGGRKNPIEREGKSRRGRAGSFGIGYRGF